MSYEDVDEINAIVTTDLFRHGAEEQIVESTNFCKRPGQRLCYDFTGAVASKSNLPPHELCLKKGLPVMLLRNNHGKGYANGELAIVQGWTKDRGAVL